MGSPKTKPNNRLSNTKVTSKVKNGLLIIIQKCYQYKYFFLLAIGLVLFINIPDNSIKECYDTIEYKNASVFISHFKFDEFLNGRRPFVYPIFLWTIEKFDSFLGFFGKSENIFDLTMLLNLLGIFLTYLVIQKISSKKYIANISLGLNLVFLLSRVNMDFMQSYLAESILVFIINIIFSTTLFILTSKPNKKTFKWRLLLIISFNILISNYKPVFVIPLVFLTIILLFNEFKELLTITKKSFYKKIPSKILTWIFCCGLISILLIINSLISPNGGANIPQFNQFGTFQYLKIYKHYSKPNLNNKFTTRQQQIWTTMKTCQEKRIRDPYYCIDNLHKDHEILNEMKDLTIQSIKEDPIFFTQTYTKKILITDSSYLITSKIFDPQIAKEDQTYQKTNNLGFKIYLPILWTFFQLAGLLLAIITIIKKKSYWQFTIAMEIFILMLYFLISGNSYLEFRRVFAPVFILSGLLHIFLISNYLHLILKNKVFQLLSQMISSAKFNKDGLQNKF